MYHFVHLLSNWAKHIKMYIFMYYNYPNNYKKDIKHICTAGSNAWYISLPMKIYFMRVEQSIKLRTSAKYDDSWQAYQHANILEVQWHSWLDVVDCNNLRVLYIIWKFAVYCTILKITFLLFLNRKSFLTYMAVDAESDRDMGIGLFCTARINVSWYVNISFAKSLTFIRTFMHGIVLTLQNQAFWCKCVSNVWALSTKLV